MNINKQFTKGLFGFFAVVSLLIACSKETREEGAMGAAGPQGEQGPTGPQGETGTANVIYSDWTCVYLAPNIQTSITYPFKAPELTEDILNTGTILVYGRSNFNGSYQIYPLSITFQEYDYSFSAIEGWISIIVSNNEGNPIEPTNYLFFEYRYVLIPAPFLGDSGESYDVPDFHKRSYEEVVQYFKISN